MLRLLLLGHDIKSIARELSISVTAANERLRSARLKLGVSSSREAARVLAASEGLPNLSVDTKTELSSTRVGAHSRRLVLVLAGVVMAMGITAGIALMALLGSSGAHVGAPKVVRTTPSSGALIVRGPVKLSVTFDRPMRPGSFSFVQKDSGTYPNCGQNMPLQSRDGRTFTLSCKVEAGRSYEVWFNSEPYMNFKALDGTPAIPFGLRFRTKAR